MLEKVFEVPVNRLDLNQQNVSNELTTFLKSRGASLVGFADLQEIDAEARDGFPYGVSIAIALNPEIMAEIKTGPTKKYNAEYNSLNALLDGLSLSAAKFLRGKGYGVRARPATFEEDKANLAAKLPHKTVATRAGLGWVGKGAILITETYGSAVRLVTVLTDAPFATGKPVNSSQCGECTACVDACPARAINGIHWQPRIPRESLINPHACREKARELSAAMVGERRSICGLCIVACPWTQKYLKRDSSL